MITFNAETLKSKRTFGQLLCSVGGFLEIAVYLVHHILGVFTTYIKCYSLCLHNSPSSIMKYLDSRDCGDKKFNITFSV